MFKPNKTFILFLAAILIGMVLVFIVLSGQSKTLHEAIRTGDLPVIKKRIAEGHSIKEIEKEGKSTLNMVFFWSVHSKRFLTRSSGRLGGRDIEDIRNETRNKTYEFADFLIANGADASLASDALMMAYDFNYKELFELLVENGADINSGYGETSKTLLHYAVERGELEWVQTILDYGAKIQTDINGNTPLHSASAARNESSIEIVTRLLLRGGDPETENNDGDTALSLARAYNRNDIVNVFEELIHASKNDY